MVVHDVEMDDVGAGGEDTIDFFAEPREIGRQYRGRYLVIGHVRSWLLWRAIYTNSRLISAWSKWIAAPAPFAQTLLNLRNPLLMVIDVVKNEQPLRQELAALQHELRRVRDGLERNRTHELEQRARQLCENIALCERDLARKSHHRS
jgi:hypothetical protein